MTNIPDSTALVPDLPRLMRAYASWSLSTKDRWWWDCAGHVHARIDGQPVIIASFEGCQRDARAVCKLHNSAMTLFAIPLGTPDRNAADAARLQRAHDGWKAATTGRWHWDCAGQVFATIGGREIVIGTFQGCEADAAAACRLHNIAQVLFKAAGVLT
jgi:hypothetical protein